MKPAIPPAMGVGSWRLAAGRRKDINMPSSRCGRAAWVPGRRKARPQGGNKHLVARPRDHGVRRDRNRESDLDVSSRIREPADAC